MGAGTLQKVIRLRDGDNEVVSGKWGGCGITLRSWLLSCPVWSAQWRKPSLKSAGKGGGRTKVQKRPTGLN